MVCIISKHFLMNISFIRNRSKASFFARLHYGSCLWLFCSITLHYFFFKSLRLECNSCSEWNFRISFSLRVLPRLNRRTTIYFLKSHSRKFQPPVPINSLREFNRIITFENLRVLRTLSALIGHWKSTSNSFYLGK